MHMWFHAQLIQQNLEQFLTRGIFKVIFLVSSVNNVIYFLDDLICTFEWFLKWEIQNWLDIFEGGWQKYFFDVGLDRNGHMSFLTGQVLPDRTESRLMFLNILPNK